MTDIYQIDDFSQNNSFHQAEKLNELLSSRLLNNQLQQDEEFDQGDELHHQHN